MDKNECYRFKDFTYVLAMPAVTIKGCFNQFFNNKQKHMEGRVAMDFKLKWPAGHFTVWVTLQMTKFQEGFYIFPELPHKVNRVSRLTKAFEPKNPLSSLSFLAAY